jgi:hypothetical protein
VRLHLFPNTGNPKRQGACRRAKLPLRESEREKKITTQNALKTEIKNPRVLEPIMPPKNNHTTKYQDIFAAKHKGTTEWDDILIKHGIKEDPTARDQEVADALEEMAERARAAHDPMAEKTLAQLDEEEDEHDDAVLRRYREARIRELKEAAIRGRYGSQQEISKADFVDEVTNATKGVWVVIHLYQVGWSPSFFFFFFFSPSSFVSHPRQSHRFRRRGGGLVRILPDIGVVFE